VLLIENASHLMLENVQRNWMHQHSSACGWGKDMAKRNIHNSIRQLVVGARTWKSGISTSAFVRLWLGQGRGKAEYPHQRSSDCG
jgi:hypothetical protein